MTEAYLAERWNSTKPPKSFEVSPFGKVEGRQDFRGLQLLYKKQRLGDHITVQRSSIDLSFSRLEGQPLKKSIISDIYAEGSQFRKISFRESTVTNSSFINCEFDLLNNSPFLGSTFAGVNFYGCNGLEQIFSGAACIDACEFAGATKIAGETQLPLIVNSVLSGEFSHLTFSTLAYRNQLTGCDLTNLQLNQCQLLGINISNLKKNKQLQQFVVVNWEEKISILRDFCLPLSRDRTSHLQKTAQALLGAIKNETRAISILARAHQSRGERYAHELDPKGPFSGRTVSQMREIYRLANVPYGDA